MKTLDYRNEFGSWYHWIEKGSNNMHPSLHLSLPLGGATPHKPNVEVEN